MLHVQRTLNLEKVFPEGVNCVGDKDQESFMSFKPRVIWDGLQSPFLPTPMKSKPMGKEGHIAQ